VHYHGGWWTYVCQIELTCFLLGWVAGLLSGIVLKRWW